MKLRKRILALALILCCALSATAAAGAVLTEYPLPDCRSLTLNQVSGNLSITLKTGEEQIFNPEGTVALSDPYDMIYTRSEGYYKVTKDSKNGLLDKDGKVLVPAQYGDVNYISDRWQAGIMLKPSTADNYDYYNSNKAYFLIDHVDLYYRGALAGTLQRMDWKEASAYGDYLVIRNQENNYVFYDKALQPAEKLEILVRQKEDVRQSEYYDDYKTGKWHQGSGQLAFVPECTLTADEVEVSLNYRDGAVIDLQGNVVCRPIDCEPAGMNYRIGSLIRVRNSARKYGYIDLTGRQVVPCIYDDLEYETAAAEACGFAYAVRDDKGGFVDTRTGKETGFEYSSNLCKTRAGFFTITDLDGSLIVFAAGAGRIPGKFTEFDSPHAYRHASNPLAVLKDQEGRIGVIDMYGQWIIPLDSGLQDRDQVTASFDGTILTVYRSVEREYSVIRVTYTEDAVISAPASGDETASADPADAGDDSWTCGNGHAGNTGKFCSECGAAKPTATPEPTSTPSPAEADGTWTCENGHGGNTGKFCSECGAAKPAEDGTWTCKNGHGGNTGKFCSECGAPKE